MRCAFAGCEPVLGLALEFRLADEHRQHRACAGHHVVAGDGGRALALAGALGVVFQRAQERGAEARLVRAAVAGRNRVAVGGEKAVAVGGPGDRPLDRAVRAGPSRAAGENVGMHQRLPVERAREIILQAAGEVESLLLRHAVDAGEQRLVAAPADFHPAEQIGLGARHLEQALRAEPRLRPKNLRVGLEPHFGAAAVVHLADLLQAVRRFAAMVHLPVELAAARDLDFELLRQRVHHRHADAVQAARGLVDLGVELAARMQHAHDHFERRFLREFRVRIDRNAAAVVGHGEEAVRAKLHLDEARMPRQRLVHGVVDRLGEEVVQRLLVGAADIHAGAAAHRLEPLQHLDVVGGIAALGRPPIAATTALALRRRSGGARRASGRRRVGEQIRTAVGLSLRGFRHI